MELALGYCGWGPRDFWEATWFELACAVRGIRQFGTVALIAKLFGGDGRSKGQVGAPWTEAEALFLHQELEAVRPDVDNPTNIVELRRALKRSRAPARG